MAKTDLRAIDRLILAAAHGKASRRQLLQRGAALGLTIPGLALLTRGATRRAGAQAVEPTGSIVISLPAEPATLENWNGYSLDGHPVIRNIQESLINRDPTSNELIGELATAWEFTDDVTMRVTLREGVTFHDGEPFTAEAAAFGVNYTWSPENNFDISQFMGPQITAEVVDETTINVLVESPDPILPARLYFAPMPSMTQVESDPDSLPDSPIGTGPYQLVEWARGEHIRLTAYADWWGRSAPEDARGEVTIKDVEYVFRPESPVRAAQVSADEAHIARFLAPDDCESTPNCAEALSVETIFLRLDTMNPTMADVRIREAIALAVDKDQLVAQIFGGGSTASQLINESAFGYNDTLEPFPFDLERARTLVEEAAAAGTPIDGEIVVAVRAGAYPRNEELGEYVANQLTEIGLNARTEVIEHAAYQEQYVMPYDEIPTDRGWIGTLGHGNEMMDVGQTASGYYVCAGGVSTFCDPAIDALVEAANPLTGEERAAAFAEATAEFMAQYPVVPIVHLPFFYGLAANLEWTPRLDGFMLVKEMRLT